MAAIKKKLADFLRGKKCVLGVVGAPGSGKKHAISQAVKDVAGMSMVAHDHALHPVNFRRLGACLLGDGGYTLAVHVVCSADSLCDYSWTETVAGKVTLVSHDAPNALRESGVPIVRVPRITTEAMTKYLFQDMT